MTQYFNRPASVVAILGAGAIGNSVIEKIEEDHEVLIVDDVQKLASMEAVPVVLNPVVHEPWVEPKIRKHEKWRGRGKRKMPRPR